MFATHKGMLLWHIKPRHCRKSLLLLLLEGMGGVGPLKYIAAAMSDKWIKIPCGVVIAGP